MPNPPYSTYGNLDRRKFILLYAIYSCVPHETFKAALKAIQDNVDLVPSLQIFQNHHISNIIMHQRSLCQTAKQPHPQSPLPLCILIIDKQGIQKWGVLIANLDVHIDPTWKVEFLRQPLTSEPVFIPASINMAVTDWEETLEGTEFGVQWDRYFAEYPKARSFRDEKEPWAKKWIKCRCGRFGSLIKGFDVWKENLEGYDRMPLCSGDDASEVARIHAGVAREIEKLWFDVEALEERKEITVVLREENEAPETRTLPVSEAANLLCRYCDGTEEW